MKRHRKIEEEKRWSSLRGIGIPELLSHHVHIGGHTPVERVEQVDRRLVGREEDLGDINGNVESANDVLYCSLDLDFSLNLEHKGVTCTSCKL